MTEQIKLGFQGPSVRDIIEALIFASDEPLNAKDIIHLFGTLDESEKPRRVNEDTILSTIEELNADYVRTGRSFHIVKVAGGYQFATRQDFALWLGRMLKEKIKRKLSISALESLAVIAYKQPVTKPELEAIRGVNADYVIKTLLDRNLIAIVGRAASPGRPLLYGTTADFLKHFGLNELSELPKPREIEELMEEAEFEVEKQMLKEKQDSESAGPSHGSSDADHSPPDVDELTVDPE